MKAVFITSSILILLIAALRPLLRGKIDPRVQYALWLLVAARLLLPVNLVTSAYSALALLDRAEEPPQLVQELGQTAIPVRTYDNARAQVVEEYRQRGIEEAALTPGDLQDIDTQARERMSGPTLAELGAKLARPVWLGGAALMAGWFLLVNLGLRRKLRAARRLKGVECPLPVYLSDALPSPCLCGAARPAVYVTSAAVESPNRLRHVLAHELTHYRQKDHWWALLRCVCLCLYWFDPLVWWAAALSRQDGELACDEGAIRALGEGERIPYGRTLVAMIAAGRTSLLQTATTMTGGKRKVRQRVKLIARGPKTVIAVALAAALIVGGAVGCTFTGAPEEEAKTLDNLQQRLMELPEEWKDKVDVYPSDDLDPDCLATYWLNDPKWVDLSSGYLLNLYQCDQATIEANISGGFWGSGGSGLDTFARSGDLYYSIEWAADGRYQDAELGEEYWAAVNAMKDHVKAAVLDTQGVEPYSSSAGTQPLDTLRARLEDIPEELRGDAAVYHGDAPEPEHSVDVTYVLDNASPDSEGWLCSLRQWDQVGFEDWLYSVGAGHTEVFARDAEHYYAFVWPTSVQYADEDAQRYAAASRGIGEYARKQVLDTQGVERYDATELRQREYLWEGKTYTDVAYWPYKNITGDTENSVWIIRLVQLATDGPGGVWIPEREQIIDAEVDPTPRHVRPSETREMGLTVTQYAQYLQDEADAGRADWATDPVQVCMHYAVTVCGHSEANVTEDCFTRDGTYIQDVVNSTLPSEEELAVQAAMDEICYAPSVDFTLAPAGSSRVYAYQVEGPLDNWLTYGMRAFSGYGGYTWEYLGETIRDTPLGDTLRISTPERTFVQAWSGSNIILIQRTSGDTAETAYYEAHDRGESPNSAPLGTPRLNPGPYQLLRECFDEVELQQLRAPFLTVDDNGQSHEEIADKWALDFEGAYLKCAPGSSYQCTFMQVAGMRADLPDFEDSEQLEAFAQARHFAAEDFGKTWFGFSYTTVFVPVDQSTANQFWAGNTWYYEGDADWAPEGALTYSRVGFMTRTEDGWYCEGVGTGW